LIVEANGVRLYYRVKSKLTQQQGAVYAPILMVSITATLQKINNAAIRPEQTHLNDV
jgi:hypothetical protein